MLQEVADEVACAPVHHHFHHRGAHAVLALLVAAAVSAISTFGVGPGGEIVSAQAMAEAVAMNSFVVIRSSFS
ncbi:MAG: hypothetical protein IPM88_18285 [Nitrospira sp.]|nr:hypothetical protein [Nitrospira sp.]